MRVIVLGAGVIGVTSAWYLARAGHHVTVLERQAGAALETSFANGGQISVSHAEPWANPGAPGKVLQWLGREDAPLLFRPRLDLDQWAWGLRFLRECLPARTRANTLAIIALARHSHKHLCELRTETGIRYDGLTRGILHLFTEPADWAAAPPKAKLMREHGLELVVKSAAECLDIEPALGDSRAPVLGGVYAPADESGDAHRFTQGLAALCTERGVVFEYGCRVLALNALDGSVEGVRIEGRDTPLAADAYVVCLGSYSPLLLRPLKESVPVYPVKGYSVTIPTGPGFRAPTVSLTDEARKLVFSRLGDRLRVAGTAELAGYDTTLNPVRCEVALKRAFELFPEAGDRSRVDFWTGLRPATPGNVPLIGRARHRKLFLNTGHGTLGWTLACGSGQALANIVSGRAPEVAFPFRSP
jgi:D-amino-acid dehydrogenase